MNKCEEQCTCQQCALARIWFSIVTLHAISWEQLWQSNSHFLTVDLANLWLGIQCHTSAFGTEI